MKIFGRLHIIWTDNTIMTFKRRLHRIEIERMMKLLDGGFHIHANPKRKLLQNMDPPKIEDERCQPETCAGQCQGMNSRAECPNLLEEEAEKWKKSEERKFPDNKQEELDILRGK